MNIQIINKSNYFSDQIIANWTNAVQKQLNNHFQKHWGFSSILSFNPNIKKPVKGYWVLWIDDYAPNSADYLCYHDQHMNDLPIGFVFAKTTADYGENPSVTFSHEVLEMVLDPWCDSLSPGPNSYMPTLAYEACDAVQDSTYVIDKIEVSNFLTPAWFDASAKAPYDYLNKLKAPFELLPGGYTLIYNPKGKQWGSIQGSKFSKTRSFMHRAMGTTQNDINKHGLSRSSIRRNGLGRKISS